ncbi:MAG: murein biosynthesis integral membrane protein MurJ [Chloroflexi bacterium SZAS-1]|nr:murein biosynthesis integral membrane protein MurJ [Chloroflexi bacterium SZAS-1]
MSQAAAPTPPSAAATLARRIAIAALLIAFGNIASRVLGLVRESVIAGTFSRGTAVDVFTAASTIPTTLYDLLINGAISAALVPVFSEYAEGDEREFWHVASIIINLALVVVALVTAVLIWQAPLAVTLLAGGFKDDIRAQATQMVRWLLPAVLFMALSGLITAILYARQRFLLPAFTTSAYNAGIILGALLLTPALGPFSLVAGVLVGALLQVLLQLPGLRGMAYRPVIDLRHPGVRRILRLYAPVALGISFSIMGIVLDRNLASRLPSSALSTMRYATTLIQFPLGLVAAAVSFAVLPTLSRQASASDDSAFQRTLAMGLKVVLLLILPATAGLAALARPVVAALFQHGNFAAQDTDAVARALLLYLPGLPAAAIDQMLLFAFYAHKRTLAPNLVQGAAVGLYALTAFGLLALNLGVGALILGNSAQWVGHMLLLLVLSRGLVSLRGVRLGEALLKSLAACAVMVGAIVLLARWLPGGPLVQLALAGGVGAVLYFGTGLLLRIEALDFFVAALQRRLRRNKNQESAA